MKNLNKYLFFLVFLFVTIGYSQRFEIIKERSANKKQFHIEKNRYELKISSKPLHYKDRFGKFQDIKLDWIEEGNSFLNKENSFITTTNPQTFGVETRQDKKITFQDFEINSKLLNFNQLSKSKTNQINYTSETSEKMVIETIYGGIELFFNNLKPDSENKLRVTFKIEGIAFNFNNIKIQNGQLILDEQLFLTPPKFYSILQRPSCFEQNKRLLFQQPA
ncbi:hypothetical protein KAH27_10155 [bacterium]|nr:hypothetical protein [bacterium]